MSIYKRTDHKKRIELLTLNAEKPVRSHKKEIVRITTRKAMCGKTICLYGLSRAGKTSVLHGVMHDIEAYQGYKSKFFEWTTNQKRKSDVLREYLEHAIKYRLAFFDETLAGLESPELLEYAFSGLRETGAGVVMTCLKTKENGVLTMQQLVPEMEVVVVRMTLSEDEFRTALTKPFEQTNVEISEPTIKSMAEWSGRIAVVMQEALCRMLNKRNNEIINTGKRVVIDEDPKQIIDWILRSWIAPDSYDMTLGKQLYRSLRIYLTTREKKVLELLTEGKETKDYEPELLELEKHGIIESRCGKFFVPYPIGKFIDYRLHTIEEIE